MTIRTRFSTLISLMIFLMFLSVSQAQQVNPNALLEAIRFSATLQESDLSGRVRKDGKKLPVTLFMRGENIQFHFTDEQKRTSRFHMRLEQDDLDLFEIKDGKTVRFPGKKLSQSIGGTDLTYEDLSMRFLYWNNAEIEGEEKVDGEMCYKLRVVNPTKKGRYGIVYVWVHKKYHALMQVMGYDKAGKPLKKFQITKIMKVKKNYTLKQMRVDSLNPANGRATGVTYLEFEKPKNVRKHKRR